MSNKHTPGPWQIGKGYRVIGGNSQRVAVCDDNELTPGIANARLIAAAPELLSSLRECVYAYESHRDNQPTGHLWPDPNHIFHARAAVAKATGA